MAILIREFLDGNGKNSCMLAENYNDEFSNPEGINMTEGLKEQKIDPNSIMVDIEAIHAAPYATRNYTRYTEQCIKESLGKWTAPYCKPLIKHHNEENGDIIGRVVGAEIKTSETLSKTPALLLTVNIPDEKAKADVQNGINQTVSIGTIAEDVRCSICGHNIELDESGQVVSCEHRKGNVYNGETAYWDVYSMTPKEVSYVVVPSDMYASNIKSYPVSKSNINFNESMDDDSGVNPEETKPKKTTKKKSGKGESEGMDVKEMEAKVKAAEEKVTDLEKSLKAAIESKEALDAKVKELDKQVEESNKKIETAESEKAELQGKIETLESSKTELETKVASLEENLNTEQEKVKEETAMKESLEEELEKSKVALKESLIDNLNSLRKLTGKKELDAEVLRGREESSIRDSIVDMKEELAQEPVSGATAVKPEMPAAVPNPTIQESADDQKDAPEEKHVNLKEGLANVFMNIAGVHGIR